ncbi:MAG: DUF1287 domain-containing protein [Acidobacteriota bacterium]
MKTATATRTTFAAGALAVLCAGPAPAAPNHPLVEAARKQVGVTVHYDGRYAAIAYPGGDLPADRGVCTDVVVRAYRAIGLDLQRLVHEDMTAAWREYPKLWGLSRPDPNIDHRRVPNLVAYFRRHGATLGVPRDPGAYLPGDLVTWRLPSGVPHIGVVSDRTSADGVPLVIHNIGGGAVEEDVLLAWTVTGHFRYPAPGPEAGREEGPQR